MAAFSGDQSAGHGGRRRRLPDVDTDDEIEEGEFVSGSEGEFVSGSYSYGGGTESDTDTDDEDARYYLRRHYDDDEREKKEVRPVIKRRRLEEIDTGVQDAVTPSSTVSSVGYDRTISDVANGAVVVERPALVLFRCRVCPREFGSRKAVHGHMRVHAPGHDKGKDKEMLPAPLPTSGGYIKDEDEESMFIIAEDPMPMPVANTNQIAHGSSTASSSVEENHSESMAIVVYHPPPAAPQQVVVAPPVAPPQQVTVHPPSAPQQVILHPPNGSLQIIPNGFAAPPPAGDNVRGFSCRNCGRWYPTHQGLGGHVAGHKNRREAEAAAALAAGADQAGGAVPCRGGAKPAKVHVCPKCGQEFPSGVALGGHMRKHYGKRIVPKKRNAAGALPLAPEQQAAQAMEAWQEQTSALSMATPSVEVAQPAQAPVARSVRIFGVTIMQPPQEADLSDEHKSIQE